MLKTTDLNFKYPLTQVAKDPIPRGKSRIFYIPKSTHEFKEKSWEEFYDFFSPGDVLVLNNTRVLKARLLMGSKEVFFLKTLTSQRHWQVLTRGMKLKKGKVIQLPGKKEARVVAAGLPAEIEVFEDIHLEEYFQEFGSVPLPPYILSLRKDHQGRPEDVERYQTVWASASSESVAAPTASLHFDQQQIEAIKSRGVHVEYLTLHVGAGTFLPIDTEYAEDFKIHGEKFSISKETVLAVKKAKNSKNKIWACGTTVLRALESLNGQEEYSGETHLFVKPGFEFKVVDGLLTNFHQPESSLLLLAASFASPGADSKKAVEKIIHAYEAAIEKKFRLFSYGDLTVIA